MRERKVASAVPTGETHRGSASKDEEIGEAVLRRVAEDGHDLDMAYGRSDAEADAAHELERENLSKW